MFGLTVDYRPKRRWPSPAGSTPPRKRPVRYECYADGGIEPPLEDLINDPVTEAIMRYDNVSYAALRSMVEDARARLRTRALVV